MEALAKSRTDVSTGGGGLGWRLAPSRDDDPAGASSLSRKTAPPMAQPPCLIFDPRRKLLDRAHGLCGWQIATYATVETLLDALVRAAAPALALVDAAEIEGDGQSRLDAAIASEAVLLIVRVENADAGLPWLARGALDFIEDGMPDVELAARIARMFALGDSLSRHAVRTSLVRGSLRRVVHDLRTPLSAIAGLAELLLLEESLAEPCRADVQSIRESSLRLGSGLDALVDLARGADSSSEADAEKSPDRMAAEDIDPAAGPSTAESSTWRK